MAGRQEDSSLYDPAVSARLHCPICSQTLVSGIVERIDDRNVRGPIVLDYDDSAVDANGWLRWEWALWCVRCQRHISIGATDAEIDRRIAEESGSPSHRHWLERQEQSRRADRAAMLRVFGPDPEVIVEEPSLKTLLAQASAAVDRLEKTILGDRS